ncbi:UNVERIFIED_CONTAM: hypothetical protein HDU68_007014 [Siphonaria sp. JEL0065]|nr:hypothetical protein HDU68_007014 [Siphonaria sp. JEL0065]
MSNSMSDNNMIHDQFSSINFSPSPFGQGNSPTAATSSYSTPIVSSSQPQQHANAITSSTKRLTPMEVMNYSNDPGSSMQPSSLQKVAIKKKNSTSALASSVDDHITDSTERRKAYRKEAEKNRRNQLKNGFDTIKDLVPAAADKSPSKEKLLELAYEHISELKESEKEKTSTIRAIEDEIRQLKSQMGHH